MTQGVWRKKLKLKYSKDVVDIVQFGSSVMLESKPRDVDIGVFFNKISLKEQLKQTQKIKRQIEEKVDLQVHVKAYDFYSFFDEGNFDKEGIVIYGWIVLFV